MMNALRITIFTLIMMTAGLLTSNEAEALLATHQCTFCHSLHGSSSTSSFVPQNSPTNIEVLCLGCHLTANGATAAVQPHRTGESDGAAGFTGNYYVTCRDCHNIHDNMPNWRAGHSDAPDNDGSPPPNGWVDGTNAKMVGREDPDAVTPYAIIQTREADFDKNGIPDRAAAVTVTCNELVQNDCYVQGQRHVIFENIDPTTSGASIHGFADDNEDGVDDTTAIGVASNVSDSGFNMSPWDSICQMCHSMTANHSLPTNKGTTHNSSRRCTDCHEHGFCFDRGNSCSKWTVPNRDLQVDTVSAAPASVNGGDTVTITVDVTNLGDNVEDIEVRYSSSIEGTLGRSTATGVVSTGSAQTSFDWVTVEGGTHTVTAKIVPVIGELVIINNSGTDSVTVAGADVHDVSVTLVTAPSPILQGNTETVSVDIANPGTFTETFNVVLYDNTDDPGHASPIGTLSSGALAASGTTTLNFSWNTTSASLGTHTLEAIADTVASETNTGNNSATTTATVAIHDVEVTSVSVTSPEQGTLTTVDVDIANNSGSGGFTENINVTLTSDVEGTIGTINTGTLTAAGATTLNFNWTPTNTGSQTLTATWTHDTGDGGTDGVANNSAQTVTSVAAPATHDVGVDQIQTVGNVEQGTTHVVLVDVWNYETTSETFDVTLSSSVDGTTDINSPQTVTNLAGGTGSTVSFNWTTGAGTTVGAHTLTATTTLGSDSNAANDEATTGATILEHDVEVTTVADTPDPVTVGGSVTVTVDATNLGDYSETFNVTLYDTTDDPGHTTPIAGGAQSSGSLTAGGGTAQLTFNWDTTGVSAATHTLTAVADTVTNEFITGNNGATTTTQVDAVAVHDVSVTNVAAPASTAQGDTALVDVDISNLGTFTENIDVELVSDLDGTIQTISTGTLAASGSTTLNFSWDTTGATIGTHTLTATWTHDGGDGGTDANSGNDSATTTSDVASAGVHDVAVLTVTASPGTVKLKTAASNVTISVVVENQGAFTETFDVTLASDLDGTIGTLSSGALAAGNQTTIDFPWGVTSGGNTVGTHVLTATAATVSGETDTADNTGTGSIQLK